MKNNILILIFLTAMMAVNTCYGQYVNKRLISQIDSDYILVSCTKINKNDNSHSIIVKIYVPSFEDVYYPLQNKDQKQILFGSVPHVFEYMDKFDFESCIDYSRPLHQYFGKDPVTGKYSYLFWFSRKDKIYNP